MKAVVYQVPREFAQRPAPDPELGPRELLRVEMAGIRGTEPTAWAVHGMEVLSPRPGLSVPKFGVNETVRGLDGYARAVSLLRDDPACLKAALAP